VFPANSAFVRPLYNKRSLSYLATELDIPTPKTVCLQTSADLPRCAETMQFPVVIKAAEGHLWNGGKTTLGVQTQRELLDLCGPMENAVLRNVIVQEYIPGNEGRGWMFNGYFNGRSECLAGFAGSKLRQWPAYMGVTSLGLCQRNGAVENTARRFMKAL